MPRPEGACRIVMIPSQNSPITTRQQFAKALEYIDLAEQDAARAVLGGSALAFRMTGAIQSGTVWLNTGAPSGNPFVMR